MAQEQEEQMEPLPQLQQRLMVQAQELGPHLTGHQAHHMEHRVV